MRVKHILLILLCFVASFMTASTAVRAADCGAGVFDQENDLYPTITGCYDPKDRFKRDDILTHHPFCQIKTGYSEPLLEKLKRDTSPKGVYRNLQCLLDDYIDDVDNFCGPYLNYKFIGIEEELAKDESYNVELQKTYLKPDDSGDTCVLKTAVPKILKNLTGLFWSKAAIYEKIPLSAYKETDCNAFPAVSTINKELCLCAKREEGKREACKKEVLIGIKSQKQECVRMYIEEWAHRGDCGEIVLPGARSDVGLGHCQWVSRYGSGNDSTVLRNEHFDAENFRTRGWVANASSICNLKVRGGDGDEFNPSYGAANPGLDFSKRDCDSSITPPDDQWDKRLDGDGPNGCDLEVGAKRINDPNNWTHGKVKLTTNIRDPFAAYWELATGGSEKVPVFHPPSPPPAPEKDDEGRPKWPEKAYDNSAKNYDRAGWGSWPRPDRDEDPGWVDYSWPARECRHGGSRTKCFEVDEDGECIDEGLVYSEDVWRETPDYSELDDPVEHGDIIKPGTRIMGTYTELKYPEDEDGEEDTTKKKKVVKISVGTVSSKAFAPWSLNLKQAPKWCEYQIPFYPVAGGSASGRLSPQAKEHARLNHGAGVGSIPMGFHMVERIRDGCGAFSNRSRMQKDPHGRIAEFITGKAGAGRCDDWKGSFGKIYKNPKITTWRLPRFDYEFLKAFIECTGPMKKILQEKKGGHYKCKTGDSEEAVCSNWHPSSWSKETGCVYPDESDLKPENSEPVKLPDDGFWCSCEGDDPQTKNCREDWCTCQHKVIPVPTKNGEPRLIPVCKEYGPFKRWLQCFYQAKAKACPIVVRDISNEIAPSTALIKKVNPSPDGECYQDIPEEGAPEWTHMRWAAEEPNILARLPLSAESGGGGHKSDELVYSKIVTDSEAPFLEPIIPQSTVLMGGKYGIPTINDSGIVDQAQKTQNEALSAAMEAFTHKTPRANEAIVGPRGCDIGGWYEMMLYQARCIKLFKLNCLCDYNKTFIEGSAEAYVVKRGGMTFNTVKPYAMNKHGRTTLRKRNQTLIFPLKWKGFVGPDYAKDSTPESRLWEKSDYKGLSEAKPGDFMIYDETIPNYRRHVAYVEDVSVDDNGEAYRLMVSEWNWGKNQDSCGNTNRWKSKTIRNIFKDKENARYPEGTLADIAEVVGLDYMHCDDPDMVNCHDENWDNIKLYRPSLDTEAICSESVFPKPINDKTLDEQGVPSADDARGWNSEDKIRTGAWKRWSKGLYDYDEVAEFIETYTGDCEAPHIMRNTNIERRKIQNLTLEAANKTECKEEGGCPSSDNSNSTLSPGDAGLNSGLFPPQLKEGN